MRLLLVGNPAAGSGRGERRVLVAERAARAAGASVDVFMTEEPGHAARLLAAPPADVDRVLACGGDGLVSEVASALLGGELPLAVVPAGRGNDLARALGVPLDLSAAAELACRGEVTRIDVGLASGRPFYTIAACGIDAEVSRRARSSSLPLPGPGVYVVELLRALAGVRGARVTARSESRDLDAELLVLAVANTPTYGGGFRIAPSARLDDGLLDVFAVRTVSTWRVLSLLPRVFSGRHQGLSEVETFRCRELTVACEPALAVEADGEELGRTPLTYTCDPAALPVVTGPGAALG